LPSSSPEREIPIGHLTDAGRNYMISVPEKDLMLLVGMVRGEKYGAGRADTATVRTTVRLTEVVK